MSELFIGASVHAAVQGLQNVYTPLSFKTHFIFCIIATVVYLLQFYRKGSWHYLIIMAAVDLTFTTQFTAFQNSRALILLGAAEAALLICAGIVYYKFNKKQKAEIRAREQALDIENEKKRKVQKLQEKLDSDPVNSAFDDSEE